MSFFTDESLLTARFKALFEAEYPDFPVDYTGVSTDTDSQLVRFRIQRAPSVSAQVGGGRSRNYGSVLVQVKMRTGDGTADMLTMADFVASIFRLWRSGNLKCLQPSLSGPTEEGAFILCVIDVPFRSDYSH